MSRDAASPASDGEDERLRGLLQFDLDAARGLELPFPSVEAPRLSLWHDTPDPAPRLAGLDEAGRGALAGPLVVGCVSLGPISDRLLGRVAGGSHGTLRELLRGVDDSKRLTPRRREALFARVSTLAGWTIGWCSAAELDACGVVGAAQRSASRALNHLPVPWDGILLDAGLEPSPDLDPRAAAAPRATIVRGDQKSLHIAAASIVAKVLRDRIMTVLDRRYPGYGFAEHKGYGTAAHVDALQRLGPSPVHRRSFRGVAPSAGPAGD